MDRTERFYKINQLLESRRLVSFEQMQRACEVLRRTDTEAAAHTVRRM